MALSTVNFRSSHARNKMIEDSFLVKTCRVKLFPRSLVHNIISGCDYADRKSNVMKPEISASLKAFVVKHSCADEEEVTSDASLEDDLGVSGDDAVDLIIAFGQKFHVDVSNFILSDYFCPEGDPILPALIKMITGKKSKKLKNLTVQHLQKGIIAGRLDEEVINSK